MKILKKLLKSLLTIKKQKFIYNKVSFRVVLNKKNVVRGLFYQKTNSEFEGHI